MAENLWFKKKRYEIPDQMVDDVEKFLKWIEKHCLKDEEVQQLLLDYGMVRSFDEIAYVENEGEKE